VQVDYLVKTLFLPLLNGKALSVEVKKGAEEEFVLGIDKELRGTVFSAGCSNWYINDEGRNSASWPGFASTFWYRTLFPRWNDFELEGGSSFWMLTKARRLISSIVFSKPVFWVSFTALGVWAQDHGLIQRLQELGKYISHHS
jgi:hypothetical protein